MREQEQTAQHTAGPWQLGEVRYPNAVYGQLRQSIHSGIVQIADLPANGPVHLANARLIATAPELLALVRAYRAATSRTGVAAVLVNKPALDAADAEADRLIAKVERRDA